MAEHIQLLRLQKNYIWTEYYRNFVNSLFLHFLETNLFGKFKHGFGGISKGSVDLSTVFINTNYKVRDEHQFSYLSSAQF